MSIIKKGHRGPHVNKLQEALEKKGFWKHNKTTDFFGPITHLAVKEFQKANGLEVDGLVGPKTHYLDNKGIIRKGHRGSHVQELQTVLKEKGFWEHSEITSYFGSITEKSVRKFQEANNLQVDGLVGSMTRQALGLSELVPDVTFDDRYKDKIFQGAHFPDAPISYNLQLSLNAEMITSYIPTLEGVISDAPRGLKMLCIVMTHKEGFRIGTRSHRHNNPGNIGNTDDGANQSFASLRAGILAQIEYIRRVAAGEHRAYPLGKKLSLKPYFSPEIARNAHSYGMSPYLPGYEFVYNGELQQFVKIYATGPRANNRYLSTILSYFKENGIDITPKSTIQQIIKIK